MPICKLARNRAGSFASIKAARAPGVAAAGPAFEAAATRRYNRELAHGQIAIEQNKNSDHDDFKRGHVMRFLRQIVRVALNISIDHRADTMSIAMLERFSGLASAEYNLAGTFY